MHSDFFSSGTEADVVLPETSTTINNRVLVVSGGGARGAWGAGFAKRLSQEHGIYNHAFGTSTGSLSNPLILLGKFDDLKRGYTEVTARKIFNVNPFEENKGSLRIPNALWRLLFRKKSLGETAPLRKLVGEFLTDDDYRQIRNAKWMSVAVVNFKTGNLEFKNAVEIEDVDEMRDWIWASSNQPLLMPTFKGPGKKDDNSYVDGGVRETVPVMAALGYAVQHKLKHIDVIINQPKRPILNDKFQPATFFCMLTRLIEIWRAEVVENDLLLALAADKVEYFADDLVHVHLHYFPPAYAKDFTNDLLFEPGKMRTIWDAGERGEEDTELWPQTPANIAISAAKVAAYFSMVSDYNAR